MWTYPESDKRQRTVSNRARGRQCLILVTENSLWMFCEENTEDARGDGSLMQVSNDGGRMGGCDEGGNKYTDPQLLKT